MNNTVAKLCVIVSLSAAATPRLPAQGSFVNLDFETPTFVPFPGQLNTVQWGPAMPGWTGYLGSSPINWILHNDLFLSYAGISIWEPDAPFPGLMHGDYYVKLQESFPVPADSPAIEQTGTVPAWAKSMRFLSNQDWWGILVSFEGRGLPMALLEYQGSSQGMRRFLWGADISAYAGQSGRLRFASYAGGVLDYIQFSPDPLPEPSSLSLLAAGALLFAGRALRKRR